MQLDLTYPGVRCPQNNYRKTTYMYNRSRIFQVQSRRKPARPTEFRLCGHCPRVHLFQARLAATFHQRSTASYRVCRLSAFVIPYCLLWSVCQGVIHVFKSQVPKPFVCGQRQGDAQALRVGRPSVPVREPGLRVDAVMAQPGHRKHRASHFSMYNDRASKKKST